MPNISVIIPSFKPQSYLYECLESLKGQTFNHKYFEIIIILNGCKEPYYSDIQKYIKLHLSEMNVNLIQTDTLGVSNARNIGLDNAKGKYICFIDDDDVVSRNFLEELIKVCSPTSISVSNVYAFKENIQATTKDYQTMRCPTNEGILRGRKYLSNACCKLIPAEIIGKRRFNLRFKNGEDALFMFKIADKIISINKANENCIYYRRLRLDSASRSLQKLSTQLHNILKQQIAYTTILFSNPFKYNWLLYLTRILAVFKTIKL